MTDQPHSIACSLDSGERDERRSFFQDDIIPHLKDVEVDDGAIRMIFNGNPECEDEIVELVRKERECCPFLEFNLNWQPEGGPVTLSFKNDQIADMATLVGDLLGSDLDSED